ncbi:MAG TPA: porin family protein [Rhodanobacteraceae bacterium]|jgi:OOP family OmpA-OmpF porin/outer membrane immunogenic protein
MRNALFAIAVTAAGLCAVPLTSHAADQSGFFINGSVGDSNVDKGVYNEDDVGFTGNVGYRWAVAPNVLLGVEGGYADLGSFSPSSRYSGLGIPDGKLTGWNLGANGHFNVTENWYISGRLGWFNGDLKGGFLDSSGAPVRVDETSSDWYAGAGFGYDFTNNFSVGLNYDYYKASKNDLELNPDLISVSAEYRF